MKKLFVGLMFLTGCASGGPEFNWGAFVQNYSAALERNGYMRPQTVHAPNVPDDKTCNYGEVGALICE